MIKSIFNDEITNEIINNIKVYSFNHSSELISDFYSHISHTNVITEENKINIEDSEGYSICYIEYKDIDKLKDYIYIFVIRYLLEEYYKEIISHLKFLKKIK